MATRCARRDAAGARRRLCPALLAAALIGWPALAPAPARADEPPRESLDHYPTADVSVESAGRSHVFHVWIADTESRQAQGLMFVKRLKPHDGMLFIFPSPQVATFWMKNTLIPLDLLFIAPDGRIIRIAASAKPHSEATIDSMGIVRGVLEVEGGTSERLGIKAGDRVRHAAFGHH
jgi:uncharacterized membrane protein (UPF0127 family)